jgi:hypothetical protein
MGLKRIAAPANDAVTLDEVKAHIVVEHDEHDALIQIYQKASQNDVAGEIGRTLIDSTWDWTVDHFPGRYSHLRGVNRRSCRCCSGEGRHAREITVDPAPLIEVVSVNYFDQANVEQEMDAALYFVTDDNDELLRGRIVLADGASWPFTAARPDAVRVRLRAGYVDPTNSPPTDNVPYAIKAAILLHAGDLYKNRETTLDVRAVAQLPWAAQQLVRRYNLNLGLA